MARKGKPAEPAEEVAEEVTDDVETGEEASQDETPDPREAVRKAMDEYMAGDEEEEAEEAEEQEAAGEEKVKDEKAKPVPDEAAEAPTVEEPGDILEPADRELLKGASERTTARFRELVRGNRESRAQVEQLERRVQEAEQLTSELSKTMERSGATPELLTEYMDYISAANSTDPRELERAWRVYQQHGEALQQLFAARGFNPPQVDLLDEFPQLKKRVEDYDLSRDDALALARAQMVLRQGGQPGRTPPPAKPPGQVPQQPQAPAEAPGMGTMPREAAQQYVEAGVSAISALEAAWRDTDPDYERKSQLLSPKVEAIVKSAPPWEWANRVKQEYDYLTQVETGAIERSRRGRRPQPISAQSSTPTSPSEPKTIYEAMAAYMATPPE